MGINLPGLYFTYFAGALAFVFCAISTPLIIKLARSRNWVVAPRADRWHKAPTALMGGMAIFGSFSLALLFTGIEKQYWIIYSSMALMFVIGLIDDFKNIKPIVKLLSQVISAFVLVYSGYHFGEACLIGLAYRLLFFG